MCIPLGHSLDHHPCKILPWDVQKPQKWKANTSPSSTHPSVSVLPHPPAVLLTFPDPSSTGLVSGQSCSFKARPGWSRFLFPASNALPEST